jgi:MFS family permease
MRDRADRGIHRDRLPVAVNRALAVALTARLAQFIDAFLAVFLVQENGADTIEVALVLFALQGGATLGAGVAGEAIDRRSARQVAAIGLATSGAAAVALAFVRPMPGLAAVALVFGGASSAWRLALQAGVAEGLASSSSVESSGALRTRAFGALIWVSNAGALASGLAALLGLNLRAAFALQGLLCLTAAVMTAALPRRASDPRSGERPRVDRNLIVVALACAPATFVMFQAFSGLAVVYDEGPYRAMVFINAGVLVFGQPVVRRMADRVGAGNLLAGATLMLGAGVGSAALAQDVVATTVMWSLAELAVISVSAGVVAGLAPHRQMGRYQATFQIIQGLVATLAMFAGPLLAGASEDRFAFLCLALGVLGALGLRASSALLGEAMAQPVACPCGARLCRCDAGHLSCNNPSPVMVHEAAPSTSTR